MSHFAWRYIWTFLLSAPLYGHPLDMALVQASFEGAKVKATLDLNPAVVAVLMKVPAEEFTPGAVLAASDQLLKLTLGSGALEYGGGTCSWAGPGLELPNPNTVRISGVATCPGEGREIAWRFPFLHQAGIPSSFHVLLHANVAGTERVQTGEPGNDRIAFAVERKQSWWDRTKHWMGL